MRFYMVLYIFLDS